MHVRCPCCATDMLPGRVVWPDCGAAPCPRPSRYVDAAADIFKTAPPDAASDFPAQFAKVRATGRLGDACSCAVGLRAPLVGRGLVAGRRRQRAQTSPQTGQLGPHAPAGIMRIALPHHPPSRRGLVCSLRALLCHISEPRCQAATTKQPLAVFRPPRFAQPHPPPWAPHLNHPSHSRCHCPSPALRSEWRC